MILAIADKLYEIDSVVYVPNEGCFYNVNGTTISPIGDEKNFEGHYTVFVNGDDLVFHSFDEAYEFATKKQKNTRSLED